MAMYFRFVSAEVDLCSGMETGPFQSAGFVLDNPASPRWLCDAIEREFDWFNDRLPVPPIVNRHIGRRGRVHGVCWFRPQATEHITRARHLAWLMTEAGWPVRELRVQHPGEILCRDDWQVVACRSGARQV